MDEQYIPALPWYRRPQRLIAIVCAVIGGLLIAFGPEMRFIIAPDEAPAVLDDQVLILPTPTVALVVVYVSGAVAAPDVYRLPLNARVIDVLQAAGGLTDQADISGLNLAAIVRDGEHIRVPFAGEAVALPAADAQQTGLLDLNRASAADLEELPGVGATLAARIIERRETQGPYRSIEELQEVSGVGEKLFAQIAPLVTIGP
ncbi:ComEA family DNA-binding protein [Chloroflexus sp.]|uniref:ComEA family DNA-binding protein n=1 Tax=Chloroflexus sp. TaxID=1904827 RepID=UPI00257A8AF9|nr:ComEA family DNA-binding protein [Chloroflexus sp.]